MNLPNRLTVMRILLVPIIVLIYIFPFSQFGIELTSFEVLNSTINVKDIIVLIVFCIASFTDFLDGYIARKNKLITTFGKFADPIADKLLVNTMFLLFLSKGLIPVVAVVLMIARDLIVDGCRLISAQNGVVVAAGSLGKLKTVLQIITVIIILLGNFPFEFYNIPLDVFMIWFTTFISLASGVNYFNQLKDYIFESK